MRRRGRGTLLVVRGALLLAVAATACSSEAPPARRTSSPPASNATTGPVGPTVSSGASAEALQAWLARWVRGFVTLGQEVDRFREAVRSGNQAAIEQTAKPIAGAAAQVAAALHVSRPFPEPVESLATLELETLDRLQRQANDVVRACPGDDCRSTAQEMYDRTDQLLDGFRTIFRMAGVPLPEAS